MPLRTVHIEAAVLLSLLITHVALVPFTKVEESFNVQATYDLLHKPWRTVSSFDHLSFPGVVPRTFIGPLLLSLPIRLLLYILPLSSFVQLHLIRILLGLINLIALLILRRALSTIAPTAAPYFSALTAVQFHTLFYLSRPLPNVFALPLATLAHAALLRRRHNHVIIILAVGIALFRSELVLLLAPTLLHILVTLSLPSFQRACLYALFAAVPTAIISIVIDSHFWRRLVYPELEVFLFNIAGGSVAWGTSPWHWYFSSALPRALGLAYPLAISTVFRERDTRPLGIIVFSFVALYSILPHKELRFVFYALPALNVLAAQSIAALVAFITRVAHSVSLRKSIGSRLTIRAVVALALLIATFVGSACMTIVSTGASCSNYPSAYALRALHTMEKNRLKPMHECARRIMVHVDVAAAVDGISQFAYDMGECPRWRYSKREDVQNVKWEDFDYLVTERKHVPGFCVVIAQHGFDRVDWRRGRLAHRNRTWVLRNRNVSENGCLESTEE